jgi:hypothetical protein
VNSLFIQNSGWWAMRCTGSTEVLFCWSSTAAEHGCPDASSCHILFHFLHSWYYQLAKVVMITKGIGSFECLLAVIAFVLVSYHQGPPEPAATLKVSIRSVLLFFLKHFDGYYKSPMSLCCFTFCFFAGCPFSLIMLLGSLSPMVACGCYLWWLSRIMQQ